MKKLLGAYQLKAEISIIPYTSMVIKSPVQPTPEMNFCP